MKMKLHIINKKAYKANMNKLMNITNKSIKLRNKYNRQKSQQLKMKKQLNILLKKDLTYKLNFVTAL